MPKGNIVQETIPLKVRIESQPEWDRRTCYTTVLTYMNWNNITPLELSKKSKRMRAFGTLTGA